MPVLRSSLNGASLSPTPASAGPSRQGQFPDHSILCPTLNGNIMPELDETTYGKTLGLYFGLGNALAEHKHFDSVLKQYSHKRFIDVRFGFNSDTDADDLYRAKVIVNQRKYYVVGTYNQGSPNINTAFDAYDCTEIFKGDVVIFFYSVYEPERFLESIPRYPSGQEKEAIRRVLTAFSKNVRGHVENGKRLRHIFRG
ncbi:hypothetical protein F5879DRAFT_992472 [Lentinula edodes]|uniref:uncharacterized protein n=1 Tax=Lentinula edodes TaxID=5353 RepID=UPI001E8D51DC|nr:uncharacterized protein C8R40DRAFT_1178107 [Lentinula edodes]KAH7868165.1 hypothetical protein C8R40DRAFT_1178107 [Lentinula edodes]KAJ3900866.1 hypothetical protein F5879DRAFT_992472 [Lentinula edodes]